MCCKKRSMREREYVVCALACMHNEKKKTIYCVSHRSMLCGSVYVRSVQRASNERNEWANEEERRQRVCVYVCCVYASVSSTYKAHDTTDVFDKCIKSLGSLMCILYVHIWNGSCNKSQVAELVWEIYSAAVSHESWIPLTTYKSRSQNTGLVILSSAFVQ